MINKISVETIYNTMGKGLKKYIFASVRDSHLAEDIFQEIFIKIFVNLSKLRDSTKVHAWVYQIVRHTIIDVIRKQKLTSMLNDSISATEEKLDTKKSIEMTQYAVKALINILSPIYREILVLSEFEGMSVREIAHKTSLTYSAAKSRLQRGKKMLREKLKEFCVFELDKYGLIVDYTLSEKAYSYLKKMKKF
jgi:RNA polymerase sigma-70 factor (ECF subfamily)